MNEGRPCPICSQKTLERSAGEWCPRDRGWLRVFKTFEGVHLLYLDQGKV